MAIYSNSPGLVGSQQYPKLGRNPPLPRSGRIVMIGSSTTANGYYTFLGLEFAHIRSIVHWLNAEASGGYRIYQRGYAGSNNSVILTHMDDVLSYDPDIVILQLSANDLTSTDASAIAQIPVVMAQVNKLLSRGIYVVILTPHYNGSNWAGACAYDAMIQEMCIPMGIPVVSGPAIISAQTDTIGTPKTGTMSDAQHVSNLGARLLGREMYRQMLNPRPRIASGGSATTNTEMFVNPRMVGSVAVSDTGFTGNKPTGWTILRTGSISGTSSVGIDDDGAYWDLSIVSANDTDYLTLADITVSTKLRENTILKQTVDAEILSGSTIESICGFLPFTSAILVSPYATSGSGIAAMPTGRIIQRSPDIPTSVTGLSVASTSFGIRIFPSGAGTSTVRLRGCSLREIYQ